MFLRMEKHSVGTRFVEKKNLYWIVRDGSRINPFEDQWIPTTRNEIVGRNVGIPFQYRI